MSDMLSLSYDQNLEPQVNTNETDWPQMNADLISMSGKTSDF